MRERVKHPTNSIDKSFWDEFNKRGFKMGQENDGHYYSEMNPMTIRRTNPQIMEIRMADNTTFSVVSAGNFMKTVHQIEGLVKYKLFQ